MTGRRLSALLGGVLLLLTAACAPSIAFLNWGATALADPDERPELERQHDAAVATSQHWLYAALAAGAVLMVLGALLLRYFTRTARARRTGLVSQVVE